MPRVEGGGDRVERVERGLTPQERRNNGNVPEARDTKQYVHHILVPEIGVPKDEQGEFLG